MGWTIGIPSLKLNTAGNKSKHCGDFMSVAAEALAERQGHDPDINPELAHLNVYEGYQTAEELYAYSMEHCAGLKDASGRGIRADAVRMCATILKPPAAYMATLTDEEKMRFLQDGVSKLSDIVGANNIKSIAFHFDEQGAHAHVFWEPMTKDGRLCALEMHNLKFLSRLNKEMPEHLRNCGWDIDNCNAYDQAKEKLLSEKEKAERRAQRGRNSFTYKAEAERAKNEINFEIEKTVSSIELQLKEKTARVVEDVIGAGNGTYNNVLFLMENCDDDRFEDLDREGRELMEEMLNQNFDVNPLKDGLDKVIESINAGNKRVTWEERQRLWEKYNEVSNEFWELRNGINNDYQTQLSKEYQRRRDALRSYYDSIYFLRRSRGFISLFTALICIGIANALQKRAEAKIEALKAERQELVRTTSSFKRFSNAYREELKDGRVPFEKHLESMTEIVTLLDEEASSRAHYKKPERANNNTFGGR